MSIPREVDDCWPSDLETRTGSGTTVYYENIKSNEHYAHWENAFGQSTNAPLHMVDDNGHLEEGNPEFSISEYRAHKQNSDRLELLIRQYSNSTSPDLVIEENARLRLLERQIELANPRFTEKNIESVQNLWTHIEDLENFAEEIQSKK